MSDYIYASGLYRSLANAVAAFLGDWYQDSELPTDVAELRYQLSEDDVDLGNVVKEHGTFRDAYVNADEVAALLGDALDLAIEDRLAQLAEDAAETYRDEFGNEPLQASDDWDTEAWANDYQGNFEGDDDAYEKLGERYLAIFHAGISR